MSPGAVLAAIVATVAVLAAGPIAHAEVDYRVDLALPDLDLVVGLGGGVSFGEAGSRATTGGMGSVEIGLLHGLFGARLSLRAHPEGRAVRVGASLEATVWYVVLVGAGAGFGALTGEGGAHAPQTATSVHFLVGVPFLLARLDEGRAGSIVLMPFGRPGLRLGSRGEVSGHHEAGLMVEWTTYGF